MMSTKTGLISFVFLALVVMSCSTVNSSREELARSKTQPSLSSSDVLRKDSEDVRARTGSVIKVTIPGYKEMSGEYTVGVEGFVSFPLIGDVRVKGLKKKEIEDKLKKKYASYIEGEFSLNVQMEQPQPRQITVLGNVNQPSNYKLEGETNLFEVLSSAGGTQPNADLTNIKIFHEGSETKVERVDLTQYLHNGSESKPHVEIDPGDVVYVPRQENFMQEFSGMMRSVVMLFGFFRLFN